MPGIESRAPDRQESNSGLSVEPNLAPMAFSTLAIASSTALVSSGGYLRSFL